MKEWMNIPSNSKKGFTLIELLVVMVILGLLASIVVVNFWPRVDHAKKNAAKIQIETFKTALDSFRLDVGKYPITEEGLIALRKKPDNAQGWKGPYLDKQLPLDPWDNKYQYKCPGDHGEFDVFSYGADAEPGGEGNNEDIVSWKNIGQSDEEYY